MANAKSQDQLANLAQLSGQRLTVAQAAVDQAQSEVQAFSDAQTQLAADLKAASDAGYDQGVTDTNAKNQTPPSDAQFTLQELNDEIKAATDPLNSQLADKNVQLESMQADLDKAKADLAAAQAAPAPAPGISSDQEQADIAAAMKPLQDKIAQMDLDEADEEALNAQVLTLAQKLRQAPVAAPAPVSQPVAGSPVDASSGANPTGGSAAGTVSTPDSGAAPVAPSV